MLNPNQTRHSLVAIAASLLLLAGCSGDSDQSDGSQSSSSGPSEAGKAYILASEPAGAVDVIAAREDAEDDADIVVVGRIGGDVDPWVDGLAAFTIVDESLADCSQIEGDSCPTPWDYCCASGVAEARTLVKFVDGSGEVVETGAKELLGVRELQTVVVQGKAQRDADGNLTILASRVFVRPHVDRPMVEAGAHTHSHEHGHSHDHGENENADHDDAHSHDGDAEHDGEHSHEGDLEHSHADEDHEHSHEGVENEQSRDETDTDADVIAE
jgi:hypothetical protein